MTTPKPSNIPRGAIRVIVLTLLTDGPAHGYGLVQELLARTDGAFTLKEGTLYPALHELEADGLVDADWEVSAQGRKRRVYKLTRKGRRTAEKEANHWAEIARVMQAVLSS